MRAIRARTKRGALAAPAVGAYIGAAYWFTSFANPAVTVGRMFSDTFVSGSFQVIVSSALRADGQRVPNMPEDLLPAMRGGDGAVRPGRVRVGD